MDRSALRDAIPTLNVVADGPPGASVPLADYIQSILAAIDADDREPGAWEATYLHRAIEALTAERVEYAREMIVLSLQEPAARQVIRATDKVHWHSNAELQVFLDTFRSGMKLYR